jgi:hypothetical protein
VAGRRRHRDPGKRKDHLYAAEAVMSIPRQVGKTYLIGAIIFALCLAEPGTLVLWTAHRYPTANETFQSMKTMVEQPKLRPHIVSATNPGGNGVIKFRNGSRILFGARERGFGRGFQRVAIIVFDEGQILTQAALDDMIPATNTHPNPLVFFIGTPPKPTDPSDVFLNMRHEALSGESDDYLYVEFSADEDADPGDREQWAKANPSYPHRTPPRAMLRMKRLLGFESFLREGLGIWDRVGGLGVFTAGAWSRCFIGRRRTARLRSSRPVSRWPGRLRPTSTRCGCRWAVGGNDGKHHLGSVLRCRADVELGRFAAEVKRMQDQYGTFRWRSTRRARRRFIPALEEAGVDSRCSASTTSSNPTPTCGPRSSKARHARRLRRPERRSRRRWLAQVGERRAFARKSGDISSLEAVAMRLWTAENRGTYDVLDSIG